MVKRKKSDYIIHSVDHAFDVLEAFRGSDPEVGVTQLSKLLSLHKNNVFRILATLENRGYVEQNPKTGNYRLGLKAFEAGQAYLRHTNLISVAQPGMMALTAKLRENSYLSVLRGDYVFYLDEAISDQKIQVVSRLGSRVAPHCTATGKVFLSFIEPEQAEEVLRHLDLEKLTPNTVTDPALLRKEWASVRSSGFAIDREEWILGLKCVAAPILDYYGIVQGCISVSGPTNRMSMERIKKEVAPEVLAQAREASRKMGYLVGKGITPEG